jgi:hypothetical protein
MWVITELATLGDLDNLIHKQRRNIEIPVVVYISMMRDIAVGMNYLHSKEVFYFLFHILFLYFFNVTGDN